MDEIEDYCFDLKDINRITNKKGIYKICNKANGKSYIGKTDNSLRIRIKQHFTSLKNKNHSNKHLSSSVKIYGLNSFYIQILESFDINFAINLNDLEIKYIEIYNSYRKGYNGTFGGEGARGHTHTDKAKKLQSEAKLGTINSEETRKKISETNRGMFFGESHSQASITEKEVILICERIISGETSASIGKDYTEAIVKHIRRGISWQHVTKDYIKLFPTPQKEWKKNRDEITKELVIAKYDELKNAKKVAEFFKVGINFIQKKLNKKIYYIKKGD